MASSLYQDLTNDIVERIEQGGLEYIQRWLRGNDGFPVNAFDKEYNGINVLLLWSMAEKKGYTTNKWMTYKQAAALGAQVKKGEKATRIVFFKPLEIEKEGVVEKIPMVRSFSVFNACQIDGLEIKQPVEATNPDERSNHLDQVLVQDTSANIVHIDNQAYYRQTSDLINMPKFDRFVSGAHYYATLAHELAHWTGHKSRLDRKADSYAKEELVAELSAAFTCAKLGLDYNIHEEAGAYLASWLKALKESPKFLFQCAAAAQKATDYVLGLNIKGMK